MARVMVVGGAGLQGAGAARALASIAGIDSIIVADRDVRAATKVAAELSVFATAAAVDAHDPADIARLLATFEPDLMLNCVGPYRTLGAITLAAAIDAGVDYVDLLDDAECVPSYFALDDKAKAAGVTAVFGLGFSPGVGNIMGKHLAHGLDSVEEMHFTYLVNVKDLAASHLNTHRVQMYGDPATIVRGGAITTAPGGSGPVEIDWPELGTFTAMLCNHTEPLSAFRAYPELQASTIRGSYTTPEFLVLLSSLGNAGWGESEVIHNDGRTMRPDQAVGDFLSSEVFRNSRIWARVQEAATRYGPVDGFRVAVSGWRGETRVRRAAVHINRNPWYTTHGTAAIGAGVIVNGGLRAPGVHGSDVFDPAVIVPALEAGGIAFEVIDADDSPEFEIRA